ncbi:MAG: MFS transporter, partial [Shimia sp.]
MTATPLTDTATDDRRAWRNVLVLVTAQAVLGSQITMIFVIGGLAGQMMAPNPCLATLPISLIVFGSMTTAPWLSRVMQAQGRRAGFLVGSAGGLCGSAISAYGLAIGDFWLLLLGSYFTGMYMSAQGFYRFAATDTASDAFRPKAISYVMAGGLLSALVGPQLTKVTNELFAVPFLGTYLVAGAINLFGMALFFLLDIPKPERRTTRDGGRTTWQMLK